MKDKWTELSTYEVDLTQYRPVYAPKDFLEVLVSLKSSNYRSVEGEGTWDFTQIPLKVKSLAELRTFYKELSRGESVIGTNSYNNPNPYFNALENERIALGEAFGLFYEYWTADNNNISLSMREDHMSILRCRKDSINT